jgi:hypothetical protein
VKGYNNLKTKERVILEPFDGVYDYEVKMLYGKATFHGAANQMLVDPTRPDKPDIRMRSYEKREHQSATVVDGQINLTDFYKDINPAQKFLEAVYNDPHKVPRAQAFYKTRLLQVGEYQHKKHSTYKYSKLKPGSEIPVIGLLREFSPSQYYYRNEEQYRAIEREYQRCKNRYGQYVEGYFCNPDGTLDYQSMCDTVAQLLDNGETSLIHALDPHRNLINRGHVTREHPAFADYQYLRSHFARLVGVTPEALTHADDHDQARGLFAPE